MEADLGPSHQRPDIFSKLPAFEQEDCQVLKLVFELLHHCSHSAHHIYDRNKYNSTHFDVKNDKNELFFAVYLMIPSDSTKILNFLYLWSN